MKKILGPQPRRCLSALLAGLLCLFCALPGLAAGETAKVVQLMKTEGTVSISNSSGKKLSIRNSMRLYNGYHTKTEAAGYAWFNLDSAKLSKLDEASEMELRKSGKKLELLLNSGNLYFNVTEPLETDETLNIRTSTMVVGIRGTCGWVRVVDQWHSQLYVLEGRVTCSVTDPVTGQTKTAVLTGGEWASFVVYPKDHSGDKCDIIRQQKYTEPTIPGFVQIELAGNRALCEKIYSDSGLDLRNLTQSQAQQRLKSDQAATAARLEAGREQQSAQESHISADPVWPENVNNSQGSGSGSGGSGGGSGTTTPSTGITGATPTTTQSLTMAMPVTIPQIQAALNQAGASSVTVTGSGTLTQAAGETLTVPTGKTLTLDNGITLVENGTLNVDGTMNVNGSLDNYGTINVTSPNSLHVSGYFRNHQTAGVVNNKENGHIVPAQGIENDGTITISGNAVLESKDATATVKNSSTGELNLNGGSISNNGSGSAIQMAGTDYSQTFTQEATTNIWSAGAKPVVDANGEVPVIQNYKVVTNDTQTSLRPTGGVEGGVLTYTVNFDANGGLWKNNKPISITVEQNTTLGTPPDSPERAGYDFAGWKDASGTVYNVNGLKVTANLNLYAQWTPRSGTETPGKVTITFDPNGGTLSSVSSVEINRDTGLPYLPTPVWEGHTFVAWSGAQSIYSADTTLTAQWEETAATEMVTVSFKPLDQFCWPSGSNRTNPRSITVPKGETVPYMPEDLVHDLPKRNSSYEYTFDGWWYTDSNGSEVPFTIDTEITEDMEVFSRNMEIPVILFRLDMDACWPDGLNYDISMAGNDALIPPASPELEGYLFKGWTEEVLPMMETDEYGQRYFTTGELFYHSFDSIFYELYGRAPEEYETLITLVPAWEKLPEAIAAAPDLYLNDGISAKNIEISLAKYDEVTIHTGSSDPNSAQDDETTLILDELLTIPLDKYLYLDSGVNVEVTGFVLNGGCIASVDFIPDSYRPEGFVDPTFTIKRGTVLNIEYLGINSLRVEEGGNLTNMGRIYILSGIEMDSGRLNNLGLIQADIHAAHSDLYNYRTIDGSLTVRDEYEGKYSTSFFSGSEVTGTVTIFSSDTWNNILLQDTWVGSYTQTGGSAEVTGNVEVTPGVTPAFTLNGGALTVSRGHIACPIEQTGGDVVVNGGELAEKYTISGGTLTVNSGQFNNGITLDSGSGNISVALMGGMFRGGIIYDSGKDIYLSDEELWSMGYLNGSYTVVKNGSIFCIHAPQSA